MRYGDDQCEECGAARVSGSRLCVGCIVRQQEADQKEILIKKTLIERLKKKIELLSGTLSESMDYGFKKNQENTWLLKRYQELEELMIRRL